MEINYGAHGCGKTLMALREFEKFKKSGKFPIEIDLKNQLLELGGIDIHSYPNNFSSTLSDRLKQVPMLRPPSEYRTMYDSSEFNKEAAA